MRSYEFVLVHFEILNYHSPLSHLALAWICTSSWLWTPSRSAGTCIQALCRARSASKTIWPSKWLQDILNSKLEFYGLHDSNLACESDLRERERVCLLILIWKDDIILCFSGTPLMGFQVWGIISRFYSTLLLYLNSNLVSQIGRIERESNSINIDMKRQHFLFVQWYPTDEVPSWVIISRFCRAPCCYIATPT